MLLSFISFVEKRKTLFFLNVFSHYSLFRFGVVVAGADLAAAGADDSSVRSVAVRAHAGGVHLCRHCHGHERHLRAAQPRAR
jgi:hypothetical protein